MPVISITTPFNIELEFTIAPFGKRLLAWALDIGVISAYYKVFTFIAGSALSHFAPRHATALQLVVLVLPVLAYQLGLELFFDGQPVGKKAAGIKIISKDGNSVTMGQYLLRWILNPGNLVIYLLPEVFNNPLYLLLSVFFLPDALVVLLSRKKQRIGDIAAGTVAIEVYQPDFSQTIYREIEVKEYTVKFPEVMQLTDKDINGIQNLLANVRKGRATAGYMHEIAGRIKKALALHTDLDDEYFLQQLLYDYNFITAQG